MKILYAEDEVKIQNAVSTIMKLKGYEVHCVNDGLEAVKACEQHLYDIIILDIMMPKLDGIQALNQIRSKQIFTPVILLTAKSQTDDIINGLQSGADDYLTKPFETQELISRIDVLHRRNTIYKSSTIQFLDVSANQTEGKLFTDKFSLSVSTTEIDIFRLLARVNFPLSIDELMAKIKEDKETIEFYASCLQKKIGLLNCSVRVVINDNKYQLAKREENK